MSELSNLAHDPFNSRWRASFGARLAAGCPYRIWKRYLAARASPPGTASGMLQGADHEQHFGIAPGQHLTEGCRLTKVSVGAAVSIRSSVDTGKGGTSSFPEGTIRQRPASPLDTNPFGSFALMIIVARLPLIPEAGGSAT
jgi:hypothetical protein